MFNFKALRAKRNTDSEAVKMKRSQMRALLLENILLAFDVPEDYATTARDGLLLQVFRAIYLHGIDHNNRVAETVYIHFETLVTDDDVTLALDGVRSIIEIVSLKLAHGVAYSVARMRRHNLRLWAQWEHDFRNPTGMSGDEIRNRFNLSDEFQQLREPKREAQVHLFTIKPEFDKGITYSHFAKKPKE